jgi:CO/xanthine dehydrogenase Mo-binding subunit
MHVLGTMQCPYYVKEAVESIMGDAVAEVVVEVSEGIGGGFGGKEDFPNVIAGIASLLSYKTGKPVKIVLDRSDDVQITTKRHPSRVEIESFTDRKTGRLKKLTVDYRLDAGAYQTLSPVVLSRGVLHAAGGYGCPDVYVRGRLHQSNTPPNGAFRGFGAPQAFFAIESHLDDIAGKLGRDPYELRRDNLLRSGDEFPTTQKIDEDHLKDCFERVIEKSGFVQKKRDFDAFNSKATSQVSSGEKRGIGLALCFHGAGFTGNGEVMLDSEVKIEILQDSTVNIYVSNVDMGQGAYTTLAQMVSERLGHPLEKTVVRLPNTRLAPNSGPTVASRTIYIVGCILENLSEKILEELQCGNLADYVTDHPGAFPREFRMRFTPPAGEPFNDELYQGPAYRGYSWMATVSEIVYHPSTFEVEPVRVWNVLDVGRLVNPEVAEGQAEGGVIQAVGYALTELCYRKGHGRIQGFTDYALPMSLDIPEIDIEFLHTDSRQPKGLGEIPMDVPAASIRNAFCHATGVFINRIPLTPENIMMHMKR